MNHDNALASTRLQPSLFVSHGSPTFALETPATSASAAFLHALTHQPIALFEQMAKPRGIVVISPHWQTSGDVLSITSASALETVHDFGGFPARLYAMQYPAQGSPLLAQQVRDCLHTAGIRSQFAAQQGLDHGAWVPLMKLYPAANVPVVQLSLPAQHSPAHYFALGQALRSLRTQDILILSSGSLTHNLYEVRLAAASPQVQANAQAQAQAAPYVAPFRAWVQDKIAQRDVAALLNYRALAPFAVECHPSDEHLMPLFVALGAGDFGNPAVQVDYFAGELSHYTLAMDNVVLTGPA